MANSYRIISFEAADVYKAAEGVEGKPYSLLPKNAPDKTKCFDLFNNILDESLDLIKLKDVYNSTITPSTREPFSFADERGNEYTLAVINVNFKLSLKAEHVNRKGEKTKKTVQNTKELRRYLYENGFDFGGVRYVRYKRSAGSSRDGKCLFIDSRLLAIMDEWGERGLNRDATKLASWEAYKALSLSAIKGTIDIPLNGILFIKDCESAFTEEVVSVSLDKYTPRSEKGKLPLRADRTKCEVTNTIWDGESLLDDSLFAGKYSDKHMLLLRNKFFKSCAFRTRLQDWFKDNNVTIEDLKNREGFVTLADKIEDVVMVTTESSLKFLKFLKGEKKFRHVDKKLPPEEYEDKLILSNIQTWVNSIDPKKVGDTVCSAFGVVKWDKRTTFFGGDMVRSSYQLINTLGLSQDEADQLLQPSKDYLTTIRNDVDFMRYHFSDVCAKENDDDEEDDEDGKEEGLVERAEAIFGLMDVNDDFVRTELYVEFRDDLVEHQKKRLKEGHVLLKGTNATLLGNGPELLLHLAGVESKDLQSVLGTGEVYCGKFDDNAPLLCARSPHVTMGNLYSVTNNRKGVWKHILGDRATDNCLDNIWDYFNLGDNIIGINAIRENSQQRLNGCDYDSDMMLVTDNPKLIAVADKYKDKFLVPVSGIDQKEAADNNLVDLDHNTSANKVGDIVNLSQKLNSIIWDKLNSGARFDDVWNIYMDVCKLAVLSGIEIDKAKKSYDDVDTMQELNDMRKRYTIVSPQFFEPIDKKIAERYGKDKEEGNKDKNKDYVSYKTAMDYVYNSASKISYAQGREGKKNLPTISSLFKSSNQQSDTEQIDKLFDVLKDYKKKNPKQTLSNQKIDELIGYSDNATAAKVIWRIHEKNRQIARLRRTKRKDERDLTAYIRQLIRQLKDERDEVVDELIVTDNLFFLVLKYYEDTTLGWDSYASVFRCRQFRNVVRRNKQPHPRIEPDEAGEYTLHCFRYTKIWQLRDDVENDVD